MPIGKLIPYLVVILAVTALVLVLVLSSHGTSHTPPSSSLVEGLADSDNEKVGKILRTLAERKDPVAIPAALPLLKSEDPWIWVHAALYLGAVRSTESVPYLIKAGLKYEWAHSGAQKSLATITGQNFGTDFEKWRQWWESANPGAQFDFGLGPDGVNRTADDPVPTSNLR